MTDEQLHAELALEVSNGGRDRRRRDADALRRQRDAAGLARRHEIAELPERVAHRGPPGLSATDSAGWGRSREPAFRPRRPSQGSPGTPYAGAAPGSMARRT